MQLLSNNRGQKKTHKVLDLLRKNTEQGLLKMSSAIAVKEERMGLTDFVMPGTPM